MKKPFILLSLLVVFFGASSRIHARATDVTLENCTAKFFSDAALTNEISSYEIVSHGSSADHKYVLRPEKVYVAFSLNGVDGPRLDKSTIEYYTFPNIVFGPGWGFHDMKWLGNVVTVTDKNSTSYLVGVVNLSLSSDIAAVTQNSALRFRAIINNTRCITENSIEMKRDYPSANISAAFCYNKIDDSYRAGVEIAYKNFKKGQKYAVYTPGASTSDRNIPGFVPVSSDGRVKMWSSVSEKIKIEPGVNKKFSVAFLPNGSGISPVEIASASYDVGPEQGFPSCADGIPDPEDPNNPDDLMSTPFNLCDQAGSEASKTLCETCSTKGGLWTAFGCVPYGKDGNFSSIIRAVLQLGLGIGGGVVVLMVLAGGFILSTSQGDPNRVKEAKEMVTSAVMGLVFVIFSITILRFIGIQILQIPGFGS